VTWNVHVGQGGAGGSRCERQWEGL